MQRIYLDANATTPVLPEVFDAMRPYFTERFGNPSSAHASGQHTRAAVEHARAAVAALLQCTAKEIVFTSGGTEGDNLALTGVLEPLLRASTPGTRPHLITTAIEHHAVLYTAQALEMRGVEVTYLAPTREGVIDPAAFEAALRPNTRLVSVMLANNETGAIQPLGKLARLAKAYGLSQAHGGVLVHTDAVQAAGKLPLALGDAAGGEFKNVDLLTLSGHKMYAPQGTGALFVRKGAQLAPLVYGGPQERQLRAGTENVPGIVALGRAAECARNWLAAAASPAPSSSSADSTWQSLSALPPNLVISIKAKRRGETPVFAPAPAHSKPHSPAPATTPEALAALRSRLEQGLIAAIPGTHLNADAAPRMPNTTNLRFDGVDAESLLIALDLQAISASFGAACQSGATEPSHVLLAMGLTPAEARASLRLSLSRFTTPEEIDRTLTIIPAVVERLRSLR